MSFNRHKYLKTTTFPHISIKTKCNFKFTSAYKPKIVVNMVNVKML